MRTCNDCKLKFHCAAVSRMIDTVMNLGRFEVFEGSTKVINAVFEIFGENCKLYESKVMK